MSRRVALAVGLLLAGGCGSAAVRRFPLAPPMWRDDDTRARARRVPANESSDLWSFVDESAFNAASRGLAVHVEREATNVNALDEVPDSSWFTNRLGREPFGPDAVARGSCTTPPLDPNGPWTVTEAKPNGFNPGFIIRGPDGTRYLLKADGERQGELATAADVVGSRLYHALGYFVPCNRIVVFDRATLRIDPAAVRTPGRPPVSEAMIDRVLRLSTRLPDGRYRMNSSRFVDGAPLGPFRYEGVRDGDPNDVVPHEDRRELRGARVLAAWLNHYDAREQNSFTSWMRTDGAAARLGEPGHVRHWIIDFGDAFGALWPWDALTARSGHAYTIDWQQMGTDLVTFGAVPRRWDRAQVDSEAWIFGYYGPNDFDPAAWRPIIPNVAFERMTERDGAWMARLIARFDPERIRAAVGEGHFSYAPFARYLERTLVARRRAILERYLTRRSPLADAAIERDALCTTDLAALTGIRTTGLYTAVRYSGAAFDTRATLVVDRRPRARVCVPLGGHVAVDAGPPDTDPSRYVVVDLAGAGAPRAVLRAHLYDLGPTRGFRLVGLERPDHADPPRG